MLLSLLASCGNSRDITGEAMVFDSGNLKLKVVQIYTSMPGHYYGITHEVWCQSVNTANMDLVGLDEGWNVFHPSGVSIPGQTPSDAVRKIALEQAVEDAKIGLQISNDETLLIAANGLLTVTFDGCKSLSKWNGWQLPKEWINQVTKSKNCKDGVCPWENFNGDREIKFADIQVDANSQKLSFRVHSKAFKDGALRVSHYSGQGWDVIR